MLNPAPLVSVVIPNYNHRRFLAQRIESVLNQTFTDFELLYLDDASTDGSNEVFREYADDPRIRRYENLANSGNPFVQWNKGVMLARGQYVWIAEADDYADLRFLETVVPLLETQPDVGVAYAQSDAVDENGKHIISGTAFTDNLDAERWKHPFTAHGRDECRQYLLRTNTIPNASAVVFRKSVYDAVGGADTGFRLCGDWLLWVKMLMQSDIAFTPEHLNFFRSHGGSVRSAQTRHGKNYEETLRVMLYIKQQAKLERADVREPVRALVRKLVRPLFDGYVSPMQMLRIMRVGVRLDPQFFQYVGYASMQQVYARFRRLFGASPGKDTSASNESDINSEM